MGSKNELTNAVIKLFDADSLDEAGTIIVKNNGWEFQDVDNDYMKTVTTGMPVKGVLACLINFNLVYEIHAENPGEALQS